MCACIMKQYTPQVMLQRMGRSWVPDFVFPEAGFRPLAGAGQDGETGAVLLAALRGWDSADPSALLRLVLLVIDRCGSCWVQGAPAAGFRVSFPGLLTTAVQEPGYEHCNAVQTSNYQQLASAAALAQRQGLGLDLTQMLEPVRSTVIAFVPSVSRLGDLVCKLLLRR